jgi:hypothetical protein
LQSNINAPDSEISLKIVMSIYVFQGLLAMLSLAALSSGTGGDFQGAGTTRRFAGGESVPGTGNIPILDVLITRASI